MGYTKGVDLQIIDNKPLTRCKFISLVKGADPVFRSRMGSVIGIHRQIASAGQDSNPADMVAMFVGYENSSDILFRTVDKGEPAPDFYA
jgi:hypothetical protein